MYDQVLGLLLIKRPKSKRNDPKSEQAFYDRADWDIPAGLLRLFGKIARSRQSAEG